MIPIKEANSFNASMIGMKMISKNLLNVCSLCGRPSKSSVQVKRHKNMVYKSKGREDAAPEKIGE